MEVRVDTDSIVFDGDFAECIALLAGNLDDWWAVGMTELQSIAHQILKKLSQPGWATFDAGSFFR